MKSFYLLLCVLMCTLLGASFSYSQIITTRSLTWNAGSQNWPTSVTAVSWSSAANWVITGTSTIPATGPTSGDKLIIPTTGSPVITITTSMNIALSNFILEVDGNGSISIRRGMTFSITGTNIGFYLNAVNSTKGLILGSKLGATATKFTMNGITKAYNIGTTTLRPTVTTTSHATGADPSSAGTITGYGGFLAGVLPVIISDITVSMDRQHRIEIAWTTQQEINTRTFSVENSTDNQSWKSIASINAAGNSNLPLQYKVIDNLPNNGINYYRIITTDFDGAISISVVKELHVNFVSQLVVFPNPVTDLINIKLPNTPSSNWSAILYNAVGQIVLEKSFGKSNTNATLQVGHLHSGNYFLQIIDGSKIQHTTITIANK